MNIQTAFVEDIAGNPNDDAPRLIFADWLEDHGDPARAQFIRSQCRLAPLEAWHGDRPALEDEIAHLLAAHEKKWRKPLAKVTARVEFRRGFPEHLALPAAKFVTLAEQAFAAAPTINSYRVLQPALAWEDLLACPQLARLRSLDVGSHRLGVARVELLARCPHLTGLHHLDLASSHMRARGMAALVASPHLSELRSLNLESGHVGDELSDRLMETRWPHLTALNVTGNELTPTGLARLVHWEGVARLERLTLRDYREDLIPLLAAGEWSALRELDLGGIYVAPTTIEALGRAAPLAGLRNLHVTFGLEQLRALVRAPSLVNLQTLNIEGAESETFSVLAELPGLANLRSLEAPVSSHGALGAFLAAPAISGLRQLSLKGRDLISVIASSEHAANLANLERLALVGSELSASDAGCLAQAAHLANLKELKLLPGVTDNAVARELIASPYLRRPLRLDLNCQRGQFAEATLDALRERFGIGFVEPH